MYNRARYSLQPDWVVFACPQSAFKIHPEFDFVLARCVLMSCGVSSCLLCACVCVCARARFTWTPCWHVCRILREVPNARLMMVDDRRPQWTAEVRRVHRVLCAEPAQCVTSRRCR
jgi:predicted O-linked N-acetylglucosamine transferase (SPINDLY family)